MCCEIHTHIFVNEHIHVFSRIIWVKVEEIEHPKCRMPTTCLLQQNVIIKEFQNRLVARCVKCWFINITRLCIFVYLYKDDKILRTTHKHTHNTHHTYTHKHLIPKDKRSKCGEWVVILIFCIGTGFFFMVGNVFQRHILVVGDKNLFLYFFDIFMSDKTNCGGNYRDTVFHICNAPSPFTYIVHSGYIVPTTLCPIIHI